MDLNKTAVAAVALVVAAHFGPLYVILAALYVGLKVPTDAAVRGTFLAVAFLLVTATSHAAVPVMVYLAFFTPAAVLRFVTVAARESLAARAARRSDADEALTA